MSQRTRRLESRAAGTVIGTLLLLGIFVLNSCERPATNADSSAAATPAPNQSVPPVAVPGTGPALIASPNPVLVGSGGSGRTTIAWNTGGGAGEVYLGRGSDERLFARSTKGLKTVSWIREGVNYEFYLYKAGDHINPIANLTVTKLGSTPRTSTP